MAKSEIHNIADRFMQGSATDDELLKAANTADGEWSEGLRAERDMMRFAAGSTAPDNDGIRLRMERMIDQWNMVEQQQRHRTSGRLTRLILGMAASIALLLAIGSLVYVNTGRNTAQMHDTYDNPHDAYAETERALAKFSQCINKGLNTVNGNAGNDKITDNDKKIN